MRTRSKILAIVFLIVAGGLFFVSNRMNEEEVRAEADARLPALVVEREEALARREAAVAARLEAMQDSLGQAQVFHRIHADTLEHILRAARLTYERGIDDYGDPKFSLQLGRHGASLFMYGCDGEACTSLRAASCFTQETPIDAEILNDWNATKRYSTAYRNDEGSACIDSDLVVEGGITAGAIEHFMIDFRDRLVAFAAHLYD